VQCPTSSRATTLPAASVAVVREFAGAETLQEEWERLFEASLTASPPLRWEWLREWWRVYGPTYGIQGDSLRLLTVRRGGRLIGALPLYVGLLGPRMLGCRRLGFIGTGETEFEETCPDYMDLLHVSEEKEICLRALAQFLFASGETWDELDFTDISEKSPLLASRDLLPRDVKAKVIPRGECPIADLSGGFERYLQRISTNTRHQARRWLREAERANVVFELASSSQDTEVFFDQLVQLHQQRWNSVGKRGCFASPRFSEFHRTLAHLWVPTGKAILGRLSLAERPIAVLYGFVAGSKFDFYQSGILLEETDAIRSPGNVAHLRLMKTLAEVGITKYDFLRGCSSYKERLATDHASLVRLSMARATMRQRFGQVIQIFQKGTRKAWAIASRKLPRRSGAPPRLFPPSFLP
jgi:CelD/BcsL family acetyltransferase involved in cellulose biosynthesis